MKFPKMTKGTYETTDEVSEACRCGATIEFKSTEIFKFCRDCGTKHNKMRIGTSSYTYAGVMSDQLAKLINVREEFWFESDVVTGGPGHRMYSLRRYHSPEVSSYIDASKGTVTMQAHTIAVEVHTNAEKEVWNSSIKQHTMDKVRLEFSDEEIFTLTKEDLSNKLCYEAKGLRSNKIDKEGYDKKLFHMKNLSLDEISELYSDSRARKVRGLYIPKDFNAHVGEFCKQWVKVEKECSQRQIKTNFTLVRPNTIARHVKKNDDAIVLTIKKEKSTEQNKIIMYSDIVSGKYMSMNEFNFSTDDRRFIVTMADDNKTKGNDTSHW